MEWIDTVVVITASDESPARWDVPTDGEHDASDGGGHERLGKKRRCGQHGARPASPAPDQAVVGLGGVRDECIDVVVFDGSGHDKSLIKNFS